MATDWSLCQRLAEQEGAEHGIPWNILRSLWTTESTCDPTRTGPPTRYGVARGLGQLLDSTAQRFGIRNPQVNSYAAELNADASASYLRWLYEQFGSWDLAVAGYHAGEGAVMRAHGIPNTSDGHKTTRDYVAEILTRAGQLAGLGSSGTPVPSGPRSWPGSSSSTPAPVPQKTPIAVNPEFRRALILGTACLLLAMAFIRSR